MRKTQSHSTKLSNETIVSICFETPPPLLYHLEYINSVFLSSTLFWACRFLWQLRLHFHSLHKGLLGPLGRNSNPFTHCLTSQILRDCSEKVPRMSLSSFMPEKSCGSCCQVLLPAQNSAGPVGLQFSFLCAHFLMYLVLNQEYLQLLY